MIKTSEYTLQRAFGSFDRWVRVRTTPPLAASNGAKIAHLNADALDVGHRLRRWIHIRGRDGRAR